ncbi:MAG: 30S ribosomal protein S6 [Deltaproteobacteria bacterium]|nr:30S ribosomal protein S6 [Deltaproteobacteria bacterium]
MRRYETIFIAHPEISDEDQTALLEKIRSIIGNWQGDLLKIDDWGVKKLGYEVRKNSRGRYFLVDFLALPELVRELERNLRLSDQVLKFQTVKIGDQISPEAAQALKEATPPPPAPQAPQVIQVAQPEAPGEKAEPEEGAGR